MQKLQIILLILAQTASTAHAHYSIHREGGKVSWEFPKSHTPTYRERLAFASQVFSQSGNSRRSGHKYQHLDSDVELEVTEDLMKIIGGIERLHSSLSSARRHGSGFPDGFSGAHGAHGANEARVMVDSLKASLHALADIGAVSSSCVNDTGYLITSMVQGEAWALGFLDATGKPGPGLSKFRVNFVGDYDLCRDLVSNGSAAVFRGNYVTWSVSLGPVSPASLFPSLMIKLGACMPDTCSDDENTLFLSEAVQLLGLNGTLMVQKAESHTPHREATAATVVAIVILCVLGMLMIAGTFYDVVYCQWPRWREQWMAEEAEKSINTFMSNGGSTVADPSSSNHTQGRVDDDEPLILKNDTSVQNPNSTGLTPGKLVKALLAFSVYTNGSKVLNTTHTKGSITCIHGIRFFSMSWVILGHTFAFSLSAASNVSTLVPTLFSRWTFDGIANAYVSVDSFFTLSGLLVSYLTVTEMKKRGWRLNWALFYFHRFWRLTPPYMLAIVLVLGLQRFCGQGPLWETVQPADKVFCEKYWWTNLLYINNLVYTDKVCFGHSWYLANDMQFFVLSPLMIIPFYFNGFLGVFSCGIFFLAHVITTASLSVHNKWGATLYTGGDALSYFTHYYEAPWCRIGPYIVGILTGYLLATKRDRIKLTWLTATIGWLLATAVALAIVYGLRGDIGGKHITSVGVAALYNALARSAWGACLCWVIVACTTGWGGFVNSFLSWSPFVVLGRLTYMSYLIHLSLIAIICGNEQALFYATSLNLAMMFISIMVATYGISFFLMLALESPMIGLEKVFLPQHKKDK
ncbi:hypothetical protein EGW08_018323 [Elysia chlorotica]|uniref:Nose resistant-to-fluoxetine protein N-terminal domain-containing protein n=1 Tax=Elysia chlorotica TaxID=188477 RepID=A0A433SXC1_ELYCH|nr:hypothetical protein EGW08_018323 [Elysia chlorotica]